MEHLNESANTACSLGLDYTRLRLYLRQQAQGDEPAPLIWEHLWEHIRNCDACWPRWSLLSRTDEIIHNQFRNRIGSISDEVQAREHIAPADETITDTVWAWVKNLAAAMARPSPAPGWFSKAVQPLFNSTPAWVPVDLSASGLISYDSLVSAEKLEPKAIVRLCDEVRATPDDTYRLKRANELANLLTMRLDRGRRDPTSNPLDDVIVEARSKERVDLTQLKAPIEDAVAFVASFPVVSFCQQPALLELNEDRPIFHSAAFWREMREFQNTRNLA